jgi:hypothetical protein
METTHSPNKEFKQRSDKQNKSLHKYCSNLAETLNSAGITHRKFLGIMDEVENTPETIKAVFRNYGKAKWGKKSTADLTTKEVMEIYEEFTRNLSKIGIYEPFPSSDSKNQLETYNNY